jgi:hypothetical protein
MRDLLRARRWPIALALLSLLAGAGVGVALTDRGDDPPSPTLDRAPDQPHAAPPAPRVGRESAADRIEKDDRDEEDPHGEQSEPIAEGELDTEERAVGRVVTAYVEGLDERDGETVCELLVPGAIEAVELPRRRGDCARSLSASIGYRDPRGLPVWESAHVQNLLTVRLEGDRASVTATTVTRFADRDQPSIEDDVVHLVRDGERWLIAKPSSTLYRAVGIDDVPLHVLTPPE